MWDRCTFTVPAVTNCPAPICALLRPSAARRATSSSVGVRAGPTDARSAVCPASRGLLDRGLQRKGAALVPRRFVRLVAELGSHRGLDRRDSPSIVVVAERVASGRGRGQDPGSLDPSAPVRGDARDRLGRVHRHQVQAVIGSGGQGGAMQSSGARSVPGCTGQHSFQMVGGGGHPGTGELGTAASSGLQLRLSVPKVARVDEELRPRQRGRPGLTRVGDHLGCRHRVGMRGAGVGEPSAAARARTVISAGRVM